MPADALQRAYEATDRQDWPAAEPLWSELRQQRPDLADGWIHGVTTLRRLHRHDDAARLMQRLRALFPDDDDVLLFLAHDATERQDWAAAEPLWRRARERRPTIPDGWVAAVTVLDRLGRPADARDMLTQAQSRFPDDPGVLNFAAHRAATAQDWAQAASLWHRLRAQSPADPAGWVNAAIPLHRLGRHDDAEALLQEARSRFPDRESVLVNAAYLAMWRADLPLALARWAEVLHLYPQNAEALMHHNAVLFETRTIALGTDQPEAAPPAFALPQSDAARGLRELMLRFHSLGQNCEFGVVQRRANAEPLGLLRWAALPTTVLIEAIDNDLAAFENPDDAALSRSHDKTEYYLVMPRIGFSMHTHVSQAEEPVRLLATLKRRLRRLREKLLEDLQAGETIFVRKADAEVMPVAQMIALHDALRRHGPGRLLCVCLDHGPLLGQVQRIRPGLLVGYLPRFWDGADVGTVDYPTWNTICTRAAQIFDAEALLEAVKAA